jgi:hypothetical protein
LIDPPEYRQIGECHLSLSSTPRTGGLQYTAGAQPNPQWPTPKGYSRSIA